MRKQYGFICIGRAGCSIGKLFYDLGYSVCFIDTHERDLNYFDVPEHLTYHIPQSYGCAGNRQKSIRYAEMYYDDMVDFIDRSLPNKEMYYFVASSGGGTGSGLLGILSNIYSLHNHNVGVITILPSDNEDIQNLSNSLECMDELINNNPNLQSTFIIDNNASTNKYRLNELFINDFNELLHIPDNYSELESIDDADILYCLHNRGYAITTSFEPVNYTTEIVQQYFASLMNSYVPNIQDDKIAESLLISYGFPNDLGFTELVAQQLSDVRIKKFENFTVRRRSKIYTLTTGLSFPYDRFQEIKNIIMKANNIQRKDRTNFDFNISTNVIHNTNNIDNNIDTNLSQGRLKASSVTSQPVNLDDLFAKYKK